MTGSTERITKNRRSLALFTLTDTRSGSLWSDHGWPVDIQAATHAHQLLARYLQSNSQHHSTHYLWANIVLDPAIMVMDSEMIAVQWWDPSHSALSSIIMFLVSTGVEGISTSWAATFPQTSVLLYRLHYLCLKNEFNNVLNVLQSYIQLCNFIIFYINNYKQYMQTGRDHLYCSYCYIYLYI